MILLISSILLGLCLIGIGISCSIDNNELLSFCIAGFICSILIGFIILGICAPVNTKKEIINPVEITRDSSMVHIKFINHKNEEQSISSDVVKIYNSSLNELSIIKSTDYNSYQFPINTSKYSVTTKPVVELSNNK